MRSSSYIKINSYLDAPDREFLQGRHEDGHLLTILNATGPGLEVEVDELTDLTAEWIPPLFHRVRNHAERQSILFLVNPAIGTPIAPFRITGVDRSCHTTPGVIVGQ